MELVVIVLDGFSAGTEVPGLAIASWADEPLRRTALSRFRILLIPCFSRSLFFKSGVVLIFHIMARNTDQSNSYTK